MKPKTILYSALLAPALLFSPAVQGQPAAGGGGVAASRSTSVPVHPGRPGAVPFWNRYARRFIYAPAFDYKPVAGAEKYRYELQAAGVPKALSFLAATPWAPLSPVWDRVPAGQFTIRVVGLSAAGDSLGLAGGGTYYRAAPYRGRYGSLPVACDSSAMLALKTLMHQDYVDHWLSGAGPDTAYLNYRYPAKIWSALITGAVLYAGRTRDTGEAARARRIAVAVGDALLGICFPAGAPLAFLAPTYYGSHMGSTAKTPIRADNYLSIEAPDAGNALLSLYDLTGGRKYLEAAVHMARTLMKIQLQGGSWPLFLNPRTGRPNAPNIAIPTAMIRFFGRLERYRRLPGMKAATARALQWTMDHPVKTFDWQGQFEDVRARPPYRNQSREQACDLAVYLFRRQGNIPLAEELTRYAEDQFVIWEKPRPLVVGKQGGLAGRNSRNWVTPCVQEQYVYWMPVTRSAAIMIDTYRSAFGATGKRIYLDKALSLAASIEKVQREHGGAYPAFLTPARMPGWLNSTVYAAAAMLALHACLQKAQEGRRLSPAVTQAKKQNQTR